MSAPQDPPAPPAPDPGDGLDPTVRAQFTALFGEAMDAWMAARENDPQRTKPAPTIWTQLFGG